MIVQQASPQHIVLMLLELGNEKADLKYAEWCLTQEGMLDEARRMYAIAGTRMAIILCWLDCIDRSDPEVRIMVNNVRRLALLVSSDIDPHLRRIAYLNVANALAELLSKLMPSVSQLAYEVL